MESFGVIYILGLKSWVVSSSTSCLLMCRRIRWILDTNLKFSNNLIQGFFIFLTGSLMEAHQEVWWPFLKRFDGRFSGGLMDVFQEVWWKFLRRLDGSLSGALMEVYQEVWWKFLRRVDGSSSGGLMEVHQEGWWKSPGGLMEVYQKFWLKFIRQFSRICH